MPNRKQIADLDLKIENLKAAIEAFRTGDACRTYMNRLLSELARVMSERLRLMLRQLNITAEQRLHHSMAGGPNESEASATRRGNPDG